MARQGGWISSGRVASARLAELTILPRAPMQAGAFLAARRIEVDGGRCGKSLGRDLR